ncbi:hypothetical protein D3C73_628480 [compost metagenome]
MNTLNIKNNAHIAVEKNAIAATWAMNAHVLTARAKTLNKLSELSKPVAWTSARSLDVRRKITAFTDVGSAAEYATANCWERIVPLYSQEYVSALLAELEAANKREDSYREKWVSELSNLQDAGRRFDALEAKLATPVRLPAEPSPEMLYAIWAHRHDMRGESENKIAEASYRRLRQVLDGTAQPQSEWGRPSKYGFIVEGG